MGGTRNRVNKSACRQLLSFSFRPRPEVAGGLCARRTCAGGGGKCQGGASRGAPCGLSGADWETLYEGQIRAIRRRLVGPPPLGVGPTIVWAESRREFDAVGRVMRSIDVLFVPGDASIAPREIITRYFYDEYSRLVEVR